MSGKLAPVAPDSKAGLGLTAKRKRSPKVAPVVFSGTREQWLEAVTLEYRADFAAVGAPLPPVVKVSCGFASSGVRSKTIGECWIPEASAAGVPEVFVVPRLADSLEVGAVLVHELIHASGIMGHRAKDFGRVARALGLEGKLTATTAGDLTKTRLSEIIARIGPYPHAVLSGARSGKPKQSTRMLKVECDACGCVCRMAAKWLNEVGAPTCGCGTPMSAV